MVIRKKSTERGQITLEHMDGKVKMESRCVGVADELVVCRPFFNASVID